MNKAITNIMQWHKERGLDKNEYNERTSIFLQMEETFEGMGLDGDIGKRIATKYANYIIQEGDGLVVSEHEIIDSKFDRIVFLLQDIVQLGYHPVKVLEEGFKEINSREGSFNENTGKWEKFKDEQSKSKWVTADYSKAKL